MEKKNLLKEIYLLSKVKNLGNVKIKNILNICQNKNPFDLKEKEILYIPGISENIINSIKLVKNRIKDYNNEFTELMELCEKKKIKIITIEDNDYPENLKTIYDAPVILYYKGNLIPEDKYSISIVGTRYASEYGKNVCKKFVEELSALKIPIISGMALGIDSMAHKTSLENNNFTYAVFGCGADVIYPPANAKLYSEIIEKGAVISEFEPGTKPDKINFPRRNRIISGIGIGTLIVETGLKGGSRITAEFALDQNKEVFAIPGYIYSKKSEGCNEIIKKGHAKLVSSVDDILNELNFKLKNYLKDKNKKAIENSNENREFNMFERKILEALDNTPKHIDEINEITGFSISDCLVNLLSLEFRGIVKQLPGKHFVII